MRIGITCYPTYGGSGVVATELGMELAARGHEIHFISYAPPIRMNPNDPHIHFHEVEVVSYPLFDHPPYTLALATKMLEVFESESLDLLHVHYAIPHSVSAMLARSMAAPRRLPFVTTLHARPHRRRSGPRRRRIPSTQEKTSKGRLLPRQTRRRLRKTRRRRSFSSSLPARIFRPRRTRSHGLRSSRHRHQCRRRP